MDGNSLSTRTHSTRPERGDQLPHRAVVGAALLLGATGDVLVRSPGDPGLNMLLFFVAVALGVGAVHRVAGRTPSLEAWSWMIGGTILASVFVLRASPALHVLALLGAAAAFAFPALRAGAAWMRRSGVSDHLEAVVAAMGYAGLGSFRLAADALDSRGAAPAEPADAASRRWPAVLRGLLLAAPLLLVFGALFMSADRVFAGLVTDLVGTAIDDWASHAVVTAIVAWLAAGYLTGFLTGTRVRGVVEGAFPRPSVGLTEAGIALGLVDLLFAAFVTVQFRYLFGGADLVEVTPGLTYAEYAREGFGQLAFASALVLPTLLVSDWLLRQRTRPERTIFRVLGGVQLLLLGVVIASAFQRVRVYQEAYGLTESRFYGAVFLGWLVLLSLWFAATVLRGRRERFAFPALVSGFAVVAGLCVANPDVRIARTNLARGGVHLEAAAGATIDPETIAPRAAGGSSGEGAAARPIDVSYLGSLSADAVPTLLRALPRLRPDARCRLARHLLKRWGGDRALDWRSWNLAVVRARDAVRAAAPELGAMLGRGKDCPDG